MEKIIARALDGDREAFARVYDAYAPAALRIGKAVTGDGELAEDAVQEAFLKVYKKGRQCRDPKRFRAWFFRIVINESRRVLRAGRREVPGEVREESATFAEQSDLSVTVQAALDRLSPEHRTVLTLKFLLDYTEAEISAVLQVPLGTVKSRVHYAKRALERELGGKEDVR